MIHLTCIYTKKCSQKQSTHNLLPIPKHTLNLNKTKETSQFGADAHPEPLLVEMPENRRGRKPKKPLTKVKG